VTTGGAKQFVLAHLADQVVGQGFLFGRGEVDAATVLRAGIVALAVQRGGVVNHEEDLQDLPRADLCRVIAQLDDLVAAGATGADVFVAGPLELAVAVAGLDIGDATHVLEHRFGAPEAAAAEHQGLGG
jgi:hypothetical protein